jgi:hypothetical protein
MKRRTIIGRSPHNDHSCIKRSPHSDESLHESAAPRNEYGCAERRRMGESRELRRCAARCAQTPVAGEGRMLARMLACQSWSAEAQRDHGVAAAAAGHGFAQPARPS